MPKENHHLVAFNRGIISQLALSRIDIERTRLSAEEQTNWMPRKLGSMMLRPGTQYISSTLNNKKAIHIPFIYSKIDTAILEFTDSKLRIKIGGVALSRVSVATAISNGSFDTDLTGWVDNDEVGASSVATGGYMALLGDGTQAARRTQQVSVGASDVGKEHAVRIVINRGPITFKIGSTSGGDDYVSETTLDTGEHSLAFTPTANSFYIDFSSRLDRYTYIDSILIEAASDVSLTTPYLESDLPFIRFDQSADIIYLACKGYQQKKIERRGVGRSWSIVRYAPEDGPFRTGNLSPITLTPSGLFGNITLTASKPFFKSTNVGSLFKLVSSGQNVSKSISAANTFTDLIEVSGTGTSRAFSIIITGTFTATWTLQRSFDGGSSWEDVSSSTIPGASSYNDGLTNNTVQYRVGVKTGNYTSGTLIASLVYSIGAITGICRITDYISTTQCSAEVLKDFGNTTETSDWAEGEWSDRRGFPSAVALAEGRLFFSGKSKLIGSVSDAYESFDDSIEGDSAFISRSLGSGAVDQVSWMLALNRLFIGTDTYEKSVKTTSLEEPITATNFKVVNISSQGSASVNPAKIDGKAIMVQAGGSRVFEIAYDPNSADYQTNEITDLVPEIGLPSIVRVAIQRQPDTRIHCVRSDGKVAILVYEPIESLKSWILFETDGLVEDVIVFPNDIEDAVYYCVKRSVNGSDVRYLEKWSQESECQGGTKNKQADSFIEYNGAATNTISGLNHLEGKSVVVWGDGASLGSYTVSSGQITLLKAVSNVIIGLTYTAKFKSTKQALAAASATALNQVKRISQIGLIMRNTHYQGLKFGADYDNLSNLPLVENAKKTASDTIFSSYDNYMMPFGGSWMTDSRICLQAQAPLPCTILGLSFQIQTNDKD